MKISDKWFLNSDYPVHVLPMGIQDFIRCVVASTQASEALVAPVVLAAAAAAVQGVVDVITPYGSQMPTSLFIGVIAKSGDRKSSVLKQVSVAFEEFEQQGLELVEYKQSFTQTGSHPFLLEETTEKGVVNIFRQGAKSLFYALDEGALLMKNLDIPSLCKRFDGSTIRINTLKDGSIVLADKRASLCMLTQDVTFDRIMSKKGHLLIESGLLPRMLISFASERKTLSNQFIPLRPCENTPRHFFHERIRELMAEYSRILKGDVKNRSVIILSPEAKQAWHDFSQYMDFLLSPNNCWNDIRAFMKRAGEHVLRLAAVLQWFTSPQPQVEKWAIDAAAMVVSWHLMEAKAAFGELPEEVKAQRLSEKLYSYLLRMAQTGQTCVSRTDLIRCGPSDLRNADRLNMALQCLLQENKIYLFSQKNKGYINLNMTPQFLLPSKNW